MEARFFILACRSARLVVSRPTDAGVPATIAGGIMEREVLMTGIGGQGVQLAAKTLATAAMREGREVLVFGIYGGSMRGGNTDATVVVGTGPLRAPPVI